jgi:type IV pilus assembly protein PilA
MRRSVNRKFFRLFTFVIVTLILAIAPVTALGQTKAPAKSPQSGARRISPGTPSTAKKPAAQKSDADMAWLQDALKDPELVNAVEHLSQRLTSELQYPAARTQSRILPRLPDSTMFYGAFPNYGPVLRQSLQIWQQELHDSAAIRTFLQKNKLDAGEPKFEEAVQKISEFMDYLGDEVVVTGSLKGKEPSGVVIAEVRKPGLSAFLEHVDQLLNADSKDHLRVLDPQQLQTATDKPGGDLTVLVRPDFVVIGGSAATVREVNAQLDKGTASFASNALGRRLAQAYQGGTNTLLAADLQKLVGLIPQGSPQTMQAMMLLDKTGFGDAKYAVMDSKGAGKNSTNQMELTFNGPRHGVAAWIAAPAPLGALDFMSPKSAVAEAFRLKPPAQMFDDIVELAGPSALQMLPQLEAQFSVNLKQDILSKLSGEIGFEMQTPPMVAAPASAMTAVQPSFKVMLGVTDPAGLQQTVKRLLKQAPMQGGERVEDGITFYTLASPSSPAQEFNYFFLDNYLVIATSRELARETLRLHRSGASLARSSQIGGAQGQPVKASAFVYQNAGSFLGAMAKQLPPDIAGILTKALSQGEPAANVFYGYADDTSLRGTTNSNVTTNASAALVVAAIAIPNLLRSRMAANEAAAASTLRTINTAEVAYAATYPRKGYARSLAVMGPGGSDCSNANVTAAHACLLDGTVGGTNCTAGKWCEKSGYHYSVRGICTPTTCSGYVATATPISESTGKKSFCSTVDTVIRTHDGPVDLPLTAAQCKAWAPL